MTIDQAIALLRANYDKALKSPCVHTPLAYALYHTWRYVDTKEEKNRSEHNELRHQDRRQGGGD